GQQPLEGPLSRPVIADTARRVRVESRQAVQGSGVQLVATRLHGGARVDIARGDGLPLLHELIGLGQELRGGGWGRRRSRSDPVAECPDRAARAAERRSEQHPDQQRHTTGLVLGTRTVKHVPFLSSLWTSTLPPCASTSCLTMASPRPEPWRPPPWAC